MQLVDRKTLEKLLDEKNQTIEAEHDNQKFSYDLIIQRFMSKYNELKDKAKYKHKSSQDEIYKDIYEYLKSILNNYCPPIAFCGEGSSRAAFACLQGKCVKVAKNVKGIAQNEQEIKIFSNPNNYICFTQLYEFDNNYFSSLMTECCSKVKDSDFEKIWQIPTIKNTYVLDIFGELFYTAKLYKFDMNRTIKDIKRRLYDFESGKKLSAPGHIKMLKECIVLANKIKQAHKIAFKVLKDLFDFYKENGSDELVVGDLVNPDNWGLAIRENTIVPIVLDAGLNSDVLTKYYNWD